MKLKATSTKRKCLQRLLFLSVDQVLEAWAAGFLQANEPADLKPSDTTTIPTTTPTPTATTTEAKDDSRMDVDVKKDAHEVSTQVTSNTTATATTTNTTTTPSNASEALLQLSPTYDADEVEPTTKSDG